MTGGRGRFLRSVADAQVASSLIPLSRSALATGPNPRWLAAYLNGEEIGSETALLGAPRLEFERSAGGEAHSEVVGQHPALGDSQGQLAELVASCLPRGHGFAVETFATQGSAELAVLALAHDRELESELQVITIAMSDEAAAAVLRLGWQHRLELTHVATSWGTADGVPPAPRMAAALRIVGQPGITPELLAAIPLLGCAADCGATTLLCGHGSGGSTMDTWTDAESWALLAAANGLNARFPYLSAQPTSQGAHPDSRPARAIALTPLPSSLLDGRSVQWTECPPTLKEHVEITELIAIQQAPDKAADEEVRRYWRAWECWLWLQVQGWS